jgi:hypothetical protein
VAIKSRSLKRGVCHSCHLWGEGKDVECVSRTFCRTKNKPRVIPKSKLYDNIKLDLQKIGWEVVEWTRLAEVGDK